MQTERRSSGWWRRVGLLAVSLALLMGLARLAGAQTLAEVARQEEARRKAIAAKGQVKVYTNGDLRGGESPKAAPAPAPGGAPAAAPAGEPAAGQAEAASPTNPAPSGAQQQEPEQKQDEKFWRQRMTDARNDLAQAQVLLAALESRVNALTTDFVNRDDPVQRAGIAQDRQKALDEMDRQKKEIERLTKEIAKIQDEARKAGVPAGWLR